MNKRILLLIISAAIIAACFIPVTEQRTVIIKRPFFFIYGFLSNPEIWEKWRPDLRKDIAANSGKVSIRKNNVSFSIKYNKLEIGVAPKGNSFKISERDSSKTSRYSYAIAPVADKFMNKSFVTAQQKTILINYLKGIIWPDSLRDTHLEDLKTFMETDNLLYGFRIFKTEVPESFLIVSGKEVLRKQEFTEAAKLLAALQQYVKTHAVKQLQPLIAQFLPGLKDSVRVKVGLFTNKEVRSDKDITFNRMPKGGPLYAVKFSGRFDQRKKAYDALSQYYTNNLYQAPLSPFETYLDNKLPKTDTDKVNIQVNFSVLF